MDADKFRAMRLYKEMTQKDFATFIGVSIATVARIESGNLELTPRVRAKVARIDLDDDFLSFYEKMQSMR